VSIFLKFFGGTKFEKQIKTAIKTCFGALEPCVVYITKDLCPANKKDVLPAFQQSNVIYQFFTTVTVRYVGRTSQRLQDRIKQHISKSIRNATCSQIRIQPKHDCKSSTQLPTTQLSCNYAIGLHLLRNLIWAQNYDDKQFSNLAKGCSPFHLSVLEAIYIKRLNPILC